METGVYVPYKGGWNCVGWVKEPADEVVKQLKLDGFACTREDEVNCSRVYVHGKIRKRRSA
jgi:hypothetical protein